MERVKKGQLCIKATKSHGAIDAGDGPNGQRRVTPASVLKGGVRRQTGPRHKPGGSKGDMPAGQKNLPGTVKGSGRGKAPLNHKAKPEATVKWKKQQRENTNQIARRGFNKRGGWLMRERENGTSKKHLPKWKKRLCGQKREKRTRVKAATGGQKADTRTFNKNT